MIVKCNRHNVWLLGRDRHLCFFRPSAPGGNYSGWGFHMRTRRDDGSWSHVHLKLHMKPKRRERRDYAGCRGWRMYELSSWRSRHASTTVKRSGERLSYKSYVRLKVCPGGPKTTALPSTEERS